MSCSLPSYSKLLLLAVGLAGPACGGGSKWNIEPHGRIVDSELMESSGLAVSRKFEGVFWTHNDDGEPQLFAINQRGRLIRSFMVPSAVNRDWESIALDDEGNIYLLDNTSRIRSDRNSVIYIFPEPNPFRNSKISDVRSIQVSCNGQPYDLEAMFHWEDRLYLVTKPWDATSPRAYRLDNLEFGGSAEFIGEVPVSAMITGADLSRDGRRLALSSYRALFIFEGTEGPANLVKSMPKVCRLNAGQAEGISWVGEDIFLTNEQRSVYKVSKEKWTRHAAPFRRAQEISVPRLGRPPSLEPSASSWKNGRTIRTSYAQQSYETGVIGWSSQGLHIEMGLPSGLPLSELEPPNPANLSEWFTPGLLYVLLNPDGSRPLTYSEDDRCLVIGLSQLGRPIVQARRLGPATVVSEVENEPSWARIEAQGSRLLLTIGPEAPGFGALRPNRRIGFNLLFIDQDRNAVSWTPLTLQYSWDAPSYWGLLEME